MPTPPVRRDKAERAIGVMNDLIRAGYQLVGSPSAWEEAARQVGTDQASLRRHIKAATDLYGLTLAEPQTAEPVETRLDRSDAALWRRRAQEHERELERLEATLRAVSGLMAHAPDPPAWLTPAKTPAKHRAVALLHISDLHWGEVIRADEVRGLNGYDVDTARRRLRRYFDAALDIVPRWAADCQVEGAVIALNGDLISGDIHDELRRTNEGTAHEQMWGASDEIAAGLLRAADVFGRVYVPVTPGNHGRSTEKPFAKRAAGLNYDTMIGEALRRRFEGDPRITVDPWPSRDAVYSVLGWRVFQSHGDALGTGGGKGFAGPLLPVLRGAKNVDWQAATVREHFDVKLTGHFHTSGDLGGTLSNGSFAGYSEFAGNIRASVEPPQQWLALVTERWCVRDQCKVKLEDPSRAPKPRVRVPAGIAT
jgi:hypothetical protein